MKSLSYNLLSVKQSPTMRIGALLKSYTQNGFDAIDFGVGEPNFNLLDNIKQAGVDAIKQNNNKYTAVSGTIELKRSIQKKLKRDNGLDYPLDRILVSNGAKHSLFNVFSAVCNAGDEVIVPVPFWVSYVDQLLLCGALPVFVNTDNDFIIRASSLYKALSPKTKAIIINSPSNPSGAVIPRDELEKIAKFAVEHDLYIISDEVYEYYCFDGAAHTSIASISPETFERTITINACSKAYSMTGLRIGYAAGPIEIVRLMEIFQGQVTGNASSLSQAMAVEALSLDKSNMKFVVDDFENKRNLAAELLEKEGFSVKKPMGAFYFFLNISKCSLDSDEFCRRLIEEEHVAAVPGSAFGMGNYIRLSIAASEEKIIEGIKRIGRFARKFQL